MHLRYDEDFVEAAVILCATGRRRGISSLQIARFHAERERPYSILDPDDRSSAFFRLHLQWFREWGLEKVLTEPVKEFSLLTEALSILAFRKARGKNDEGAELYINEAGDRTGVLAVRPERMEKEPELEGFLRHELTHLHDMVDPEFGYDPVLPISGPALSSHSLARERYRLVWDVSIDGRLTQKGRQTIATQDQRWSEFSRAFSFWPEAKQKEVFDGLWTNPVPTHSCFAKLVCEPREMQTAAGPRPGSPCPLCGFPTFNWTEAALLQSSTVSAIRADFPEWAPEYGTCARCSEIYRVNHSKMVAAV